MYIRIRKRIIMCSVLGLPTTLLLLLTGTFIFMNEQAEVEMLLPKLDNLQGRLKDFEVLIESERKRILAQDFQEFMIKKCVPEQRTLILGLPRTADFGRFKQYEDEVQNIRFSEPIKSIRKTLIDHYYDHASNDCETLLSEEYGLKYIEPLYGMTCTRDITDIKEGYSLPEESLHVGLPEYLRELPGTADYVITYVNMVKNAMILANGDIYTEHFLIVPQTCVNSIHELCPRNAHYNYSSLEIVDEVFSISQQSQPWESRNNLVQNLPRIAPYLDFLERNPQIFIQAENSGRHLIALGINAARIIHRDIKAKIVYVPAGTVCARPPVLTTQILSKALKRKLLPRHNISGQRFSILRNVVLFIGSNFESDDPVLEMLRKHLHQDNLEVLSYHVHKDKKMSIESTAELFGRAVIIVAPHQANDNVMFANPGTILIEGVCYDHDYDEPGDRGMQNLLYRNLAFGLGLRYYGLVFKHHGCFENTAQEIEEPFLEALTLYRKGLI